MKEKRIFTFDKVEYRNDNEGERGKIVGYSAVYNSRSVDLGGFVEEIEPGAFTKTLAQSPDVRATIDHEGGLTTLGRTRSGTLKLSEDKNGLAIEIDPPDTQAGRDIKTLLQRGDIDQMSFMFRVPKGGDVWRELDNGLYLRTLKEIDLEDGDVSIVTYPAYPQTSVEARSKVESLTEAGNDLEDDAQRQARLAHRKRKLELLKLKE